MSKHDNFLVISDLQVPFEHSLALSFCKELVRCYKIPEGNIYCVGDETDEYWGSQWKKDINGLYSAKEEFELSNERLKPWFKAFPIMQLCTSNHGDRWQRKALEADIPEQLMRRRQDVMGAPPGWRWRKRWIVKTERPFLVEHGDDYGGQYPHVAIAKDKGISAVIGHHHSIAGIEFIKTNGAMDGCEDAGFNIWGAASGSLIAFEKYAFQYARAARKKPQIGTTVVLNSGKLPLWVPLEG